MNIIIVGCGRIGSTLVEELSGENHDISIIDEKTVYYAKEGFLTVAISWIVMSFFGAMPFVINGDIPSVVDAMFETDSGFTTTGSSILTDVEALARCSLLTIHTIFDRDLYDLIWSKL